MTQKTKKQTSKKRPLRFKSKKSVLKLSAKKKKSQVKSLRPKAKSLKKKTTAAKITLPIAKKTNLAPILSRPLLLTAPKPEEKVKIKKAFISPHVLDLKKLQADKLAQKLASSDSAQSISAELKSKFLAKKSAFIKNFSQTKTPTPKPITYVNQNIEPATEPKPKIKIKPIKTSAPIKLPKINWPTFSIRLPKISLPKPRLNLADIKIGKLLIPAYWQKAMFSFFVFCLIFVLPFCFYSYYQKLQGQKNLVLAKTAEALDHLLISQKAASAHDFDATQTELTQASQGFSEAKKELDNINILAQTALILAPQINKQYLSANKLLAVGEKLSASAATLTKTIDSLNIKDSTSLNNLNLTKKIILLKDSLNTVLPDIKAANNDLQTIYLEEIPAPYQAKVSELQKLLPLAEKDIETFINSSDLLLNLLGNDSKKRYLLIFQNNSEIRPTGGFIGSFAVVDIDQGNIEKINIPGGGPYDLLAGLKVSVESPRPLHIMNQRWEFQDANWFADLPTSSQKLMWFYEKSGGPSVDGIVYINATFLAKLLEITGPIELPTYNKTITTQNFMEEIQKNVEVEYNKETNQPKQIIADLTNKLLETLSQKGQQQFTTLLGSVFNALTEKEIQFYFNDFNLEKLILDNNWGGQQQNTERDYLQVVSTNIAGEKTDAKIKQTAQLEVKIADDGSIINTLTITKEHSGYPGENFYGVPNLDYLRIYVPKDSELISAEGFEKLPEDLFLVMQPELYSKDPEILASESTKIIDDQSLTETFNENNKTVFANWMKVNPGQSQTVKITYKLPFSLKIQATTDSGYLEKIKNSLHLATTTQMDYYSLLWQKQSGKENFNVKITVSLPQQITLQKTYPDTLLLDKHNLNYSVDLESDKFLAIIYNLAD